MAVGGVKTLYQCTICEGLYEKKKDAVDCAAQRYRPKFKPGDIVMMGYGYGWLDGDKRWVANPKVLENLNRPCPNGDGNCFGSCCTMGFYYVVTAVGRDKGDPHRPVYHLKTKAMTGKKGHRAGVSLEEYLTKVKSPPKFVVEDSKDVIGQMFSQNRLI